ncbi:hypothetical protein HJC23_005818 [Cyclotella cryptica]|uniref:HEAT repeat-containing protein 1 n=1 Tax=Cyclotella cryptica TaxID=29204 RepID=A0ABD3QZN5_9STRA|eukprot:CCRYP_000308-RA/>CCRYP_000308-RA protein AED:0.01 eAED:0.01 QI:316/1/1/1/1/1/2/4044/1982
MHSPHETVLDHDHGFDPDETLPLPDDTGDNATESHVASSFNGEVCNVQQLLNTLDNSNGKVDEASSSSLLSHLASLKQGGWNEDSYQLAVRAFRIAMPSMDPNNNGGGGRQLMDPIMAKRILTHGILPLAYACPPRMQHGQMNENENCDAVWTAKLVRSVVLELLPTAFRINDSAEANTQQHVNDAIKILLPTFLHRMDTDEASQILSSPIDESPPQDTVDRILDQFCGLDPHCHVYPHATAGLLLALREFDSFSGGRLSRRRVWQTRRNTPAPHVASHGREYVLEYVDRPTDIVRMAIASLEELASGAKDMDALPPLVYQLGLLPMKLLQCGSAEAKAVKVRGGENEKQRGMRLRRLVLEGIAEALDDGALGRVHSGAGPAKASSGVVVQTSTKQTNREEEWRWSRYTSLSHLGTCLRSDPEMSKAVLSMLSGEILSTPSAADSSNASSGSNPAPFRHQRLTPFKLAMGISMASSVPRMRQAALGCVRDLILEEETIRIRCGLSRDGKRIGFGKPWMLCLVRCLEVVSKGEETSLKEFQLERESGNLGHMLRCLVLVAKFAESSDHGGGMGSGGVSEGCASSILQSLISLGFLLVECVKKDERSRNNDACARDLLANTLDGSFLNHGNSCSNAAETSAHKATACIGRVLLCYLFYQSASASSHFMASSLSSISRSSNEGGASLCRFILKSSIDKFCGMAPNALEYAFLLTDLLQFSPTTLKSVTQTLDTNGDGLDDRQKEEVIALSMATHHIPMLIDTLSNVPGGGIQPHVAARAIIPAIGHLLLLQASAGSLRPGLAGYLWKKSDIIDHVDHAFLLAKKSLFCIDEEKRKCAAMTLVSLIRVAVVACAAGNSRSASKWSPILDEMKGCLRRCLTQHQQSVRVEAYSSLAALLPSDAAASNNTQTQDTTSPTSVSGGAASSPATSCSRHNSQYLIPPAARDSLAEIVCSILSSQIERYVTTPPEDIEERKARHQRATAIGSQLSQMAAEEAPSPNKSLGNSMPLRFEMIISMRSPPNDSKPKGKSKKSNPIAQTLLSDALGRISEPLGFLIASCNCACSCATSNRASDDKYDLKHQAELTDAIKSLRRRIAGCRDIEEYLTWLKSNKQIFEITSNSRRKEEMAISKISTLITVAVTAEALLSTCEWDNENDEEFMEVNVTNDEVENLFNLRQDAVSRASEILSSFVNPKPKAIKKLKERDVNAEESNVSKKKKRKKSVEDDDEETESGEGALTTTTEVNLSVQAKNRKLVEEAIISLTPALPQEFLANALRRFGAGAELKNNRSVEGHDNDDGNSDEAVKQRLARCMSFRRFVITKSLLLIGGISKVVKSGLPFSDLGANTLSVIASSLSLGPMLFAEFCSHCYHIERTSISPDMSAQELPLTQLSLRAFSLCVSGMASDARHSLTKAQRVNAILTCAMTVASSVAPSSKESWTHYRDLKTDDSVPLNAPEKERDLMKALLAFVSGSSSSRMCLLKELLSQSMNGEAAECVYLILSAASAFTDPNLREQCGVMLLKCYDTRDAENLGVLGLDYGEATGTDTCLSRVVEVGFTLSNELHGETHVPLPPNFLRLKSSSNFENLRLVRSKVCLPTTTIENWPSKHHDRLREEMIASKMCVVGIVQQLSWALTATLTVGNRFLATFGREARTSKQLSLPSIKFISRTSQSNFDREKSNICRLVSVCIEESLDSADFVTFKLIPNLSDSTLDLAQRFVACLLHTVSKVICASAPSAEFVDVNGIFASSLLKSAKRLYSNLARFILSYMANPQCMACEETRALFDFTTITLKPRISALLLTLQEKHETVGGKYLAESKIESHGRIASLLVFEKEKLDNALLKLVATLKQTRLEDDSSWLGKHVVSSLDSDFVIKGVERAKAREAPQTKKRKVKREPTETKSKKKAKANKREHVDESEAADASQENSECSDDESEAVSCEVISMGNLTEDMGDNESEDDSGGDMDDDNEQDLRNQREEDSEEEAEFDD